MSLKTALRRPPRFKSRFSFHFSEINTAIPSTAWSNGGGVAARNAPFVMGTSFYGPTFGDAVGTPSMLPLRPGKELRHDP